MSTELTVIERASAVLSFDETKAALIPLVEASARIVGISNGAGYAEAQSARMKLRNTRVEIEKRGKAAREDATAFSKAVIAKEKELVAVIAPEEDRLQTLQDEWDAAIAREKAAKAEAERLRVLNIRLTIDAVRGLPLQAVGATSAQIAELINRANTPLGIDAQEFEVEAKRAQQEAVDRLTAAHAAAVADEIRREEERKEREAEAARLAAERAELERLRAEQAKREADERAKLAAEREAEEKRQAEARAAQIEADRKAAAEREAAAEAGRQKVAEELRMQRAAEEQARAERQAKEDAERAARAIVDAEIRERQRKEQAAIDARIAEIAEQKAEQDRAARQRELDAATLIDAATEAHAFLDARFPAEFVTLKLGAALVREVKKPVRKAAA